MSGPRKAKITLEFREVWLSGTGAGKGKSVDAVCFRDADGLPAMPMSQIKGTLRETANLLIKSDPSVEEALVRLLGKGPNDSRQDGDAALSFVDEANIISGREEAKADPNGNFTEIASTQISETGAAEDRTLRRIEVAWPAVLEGIVEWIGRDEPDEDWVETLDLLCAATPAFGKSKFDGIGDALARAEPVVDDPIDSRDEGAALPNAVTKRLVRVLLTQTRPAVFSKSSATVGQHQTLPAPTGASLLGWCASGGRYARLGHHAFDVIDAGRVRFSDARAVLDDGTIAFAAPRNLFAPKMEMSKARKGGKLDPSAITVGRPPPSEETERKQFEPVKAIQIAGDLREVKPETGVRLRTATKNGRAAEGMLFEYQHLQAHGQPRYMVEIEADDGVDEDAWTEVISAFRGQSLRLGRAKATGQGGGFETDIEYCDRDGPTKLSAGRTGQIVIQAMSDLALLDKWGSPTACPDGAAFGLPDGTLLMEADSVISLRRWAPWNGTLRRRDTERQVIEAGSVLIYKLTAPVPNDLILPTRIGIWQAVGLGRYCIDPPWLGVDKTTLTAMSSPVVAKPRHPSEEESLLPELVSIETGPATDSED